MGLSHPTMRDVPALAWCSFAVPASWLSCKNAHWAAIAGIAFSVCALLRSTNTLVIFPVAAAGAPLYCTKFTLVRCEHFNRDTFRNVEQACVAACRPIYAILFPHEIEEANNTPPGPMDQSKRCRTNIDMASTRQLRT